MYIRSTTATGTGSESTQNPDSSGQRECFNWDTRKSQKHTQTQWKSNQHSESRNSRRRRHKDNNQDRRTREGQRTNKSRSTQTGDDAKGEVKNNTAGSRGRQGYADRATLIGVVLEVHMVAAVGVIVVIVGACRRCAGGRRRNARRRGRPSLPRRRLPPSLSFSGRERRSKSGTNMLSRVSRKEARR